MLSFLSVVRSVLNKRYSGYLSTLLTLDGRLMSDQIYMMELL